MTRREGKERRTIQRSMPHLRGIRLIGGVESALMSAPIPWQIPDVAGSCLLGPVVVIVPPVVPRPSPHVYVIDELAFGHSKQGSMLMSRLEH